MAQPSHYYEPGVWYHITVNTAARYKLFDNAGYARILQGRFNHARKRYVLLCAAYVIMPDHFHWLIYPTEAGFEDFATEQIQKGRRYASDPAAGFLSVIVEDVKRGTLLAIKRLARSLPRQLWRQGFWQRSIHDMQQLPEIIARIHNNPVRVNLCDDPGDYAYSSYKAFTHDHPHIVILDRMIWDNLKFATS